MLQVLNDFELRRNVGNKRNGGMKEHYRKKEKKNSFIFERKINVSHLEIENREVRSCRTGKKKERNKKIR